MKPVKYKKGSLKQLQRYMDFKIKQWGFEDETLSQRLLLLTEELGELAHACRKLNGIKVDRKRELINEAGDEVADLFNLLFAVAIGLGLDIEKEVLKKHKKVDKRAY